MCRRKPLDGDRQSGELIASHLSKTRLHSIDDTHGGMGGGVSTLTFAGTAHHMIGGLEHPIGELGRNTHILRTDVGSIERVDETSHGSSTIPRHLGVVLGQKDHALGATHCQAGTSGLPGHPLGKAEYVVQRIAFMLVVPSTAAAQRIAQSGRMDRDDGSKSRLLINVVAHTFVTMVGHGFERLRCFFLHSRIDS